MDKITHHSVHELHQENLSTGHNLSEDTIQIVNVIGGIDSILIDYLTKPELMSSIDNIKLQQIHEIISRPKHLQNKQIAQNKIIQQTIDDDKEGIAKVLKLNNRYTWLHLLFNINMDDKLYLFIWHRITFIFMCIICVLAFVLYSLFPTNKLIICFDIILTILWIPYIFLIVLSANIVASKLILKSFEFYLKMYYVAIYSICAIVIWISDIFVMVEYDTIHKKLMIAAWSISIPVFLLMQAFTFMLDAYNINWKIKILLPSITAVNFFILWLKLTLFLYTNDNKQDVSIIQISENIHISLYSQQQGAAFIISIFCFKQSFMAWYRLFFQRKKYKNAKAILMAIKTVPRIQWKISKSTDNIKMITADNEMDKSMQEMEVKKYRIKKIKSKRNSFSISEFDVK